MRSGFLIKLGFLYDGYRRQRILKAYAVTSWLNKENSSEIVHISLAKAIKVLLEQFEKKGFNNLYALLGKTLDLESLFMLKLFSHKWFANTAYFQEGLCNAYSNVDSRANYSVPKLLETNNYLLFLGLNPRLELPVLNLRYRKEVRENKMTVLSLGPQNNLNYSGVNLGTNMARFLSAFSKGKHIFAKLCKKKDNIAMLLVDLFFCEWMVGKLLSF